jgi:NADH-quinone oxidoreductase subunit N
MSTFVSPALMLQALAPELLMCAGAMALLLAGVWSRPDNTPGSAEGAERTGMIARFATMLCVLTAIVVIIMWGDHAGGTPDSRLAGDGFRWAIDLVVLAGTGASLLLLDADHHRSGAYSPEVPVLLLLAACGMMVLAAARDLMFIFLGIELMSLAIYVLAGVNRRSARGAEAAIKYFLLGSFSTGFLLYGMALLFGAAGSTRLADIGTWVASHPGLTPMSLIGVGLLLVGFSFKIAAAPFHLWTPDVYDGAPLPITAFMSALVKVAAFATFIRVMTEALPGAILRWHPVLWWLAVATMVLGNVLALSQRNVVRMLAYSSIAHAGYLLTAIIVNSAAGQSALVFYAVSYTLATMGAFGVLILANDGRDRSPTLDDLAGLWTVRPGLAAAMAVFLLALLGMPLAGGMGFFAKWYLLQAALQSSVPQTQLAVILVLSSAISAAYYLNIVAAMFMRPRPDSRAVPAALPATAGLIGVCAVLLLLFGVFPTPVSHFARSSSIVVRSPADAPDALPRRTAPFSTASRIDSPR